MEVSEWVPAIVIATALAFDFEATLLKLSQSQHQRVLNSKHRHKFRLSLIRRSVEKACWCCCHLICNASTNKLSSLQATLFRRLTFQYLSLNSQKLIRPFNSPRAPPIRSAKFCWVKIGAIANLLYFIGRSRCMTWFLACRKEQVCLCILKGITSSGCLND